MSLDLKLKVFTVRLKKFKGKKNAERNWSELFNLYKGDDSQKFNGFFKAYIESFQKKFVTYKNWPKAITIPELDLTFKSNERIFLAQFEGGQTNQTFRVKKMENPEEQVLIDKNQVTTLPFYLLFYIPENSNVGLLIVQSIAENSMHDILMLNFSQFVRSVNSDLNIDYSEHITKDAVEKIKKGKIKSVTIRKSGLSKDAGDKIFSKKFMDYGNLKIEIKVSLMDKLSNKISAIDDISKFIKENVLGNSPNIFEVDNIEHLGLDKNSEVIAQFEHSGKKASAKIEKGLKLSPIYYIDEKDVPLNVDNHPDAKKMKSYMLSFVDQMIKEIGL